jgi:hypothetical protein
MSSSNYSFFEIQTKESHYTNDELEKVSNLFNKKLNDKKLEEWLIKQLFTDIFYLNDGKITVQGDSETLRDHYEEPFGIAVGALVDSFRECDIVLEIPDQQPVWECDTGAFAWKMTYQVFERNESEMNESWKEGNEDLIRVYCDEGGEEEDM